MHPAALAAALFEPRPARRRYPAREQKFGWGRVPASKFGWGREAERENEATLLLSEDDQLCLFLGGPQSARSERQQALWCVPTGCRRCALFVSNDAALLMHNGTHTLPLAGDFSAKYVYTRD